MKTQIFSHKGVLGASTDLKDGKFINNPVAPGQIGCIISTKEIQITKKAKELIANAPKKGITSPITLIKHAGSKGSAIGLAGHWKHVFANDTLSISQTCDITVLNDIEVVKMKVPTEFIEEVEKNTL